MKIIYQLPTTLILVLSLFSISYSQILNIDDSLDYNDLTLKESNNFIGRVIDYYTNNNGNIYVIDKNSVHVFNNKGVEINYFSAKGNGPGEYANLGKIIIDSSDNIYLEDLGNQKILKYDKDFSFLWETKKNSTTPITKLILINDSLLCTFSFAEIENVISLYDTRNGKPVNKFGENSDLFIKYQEYRSGGDVIYSDDSIYYINSLEYSLYKYNLLGELLKNKRIKADHFKEIRERNKSISGLIKNFSTIMNIYIIDNYIYVFSSPPSKNMKPQKPVLDIIDLQGNIIASGLKSKFLVQTKQVSSNKFIKLVDQRMFYPKDDKRSKIVFRVITIK